MKPSQIVFACVALSVGAGLAPAHGQTPQRDPAALLERADADGDGAIAWTEVVAMRTDMFGRLDRNGDGYADASDRPRVGGPRFDEAFSNAVEQFDDDGDGRIARAEMLDGPSGAFAEADANSDAVLTPDELEAFRSTLAANGAR